MQHEHIAPSLYVLAQEALAEANGIVADALEVLDQRLTTDNLLRRSLLSEALRQAMRTAVSSAHLEDRRAVVEAVRSAVALTTPPAQVSAPATPRPALTPIQAGRQQVRLLAQGLARSILDFPLLDGTKLRHATHQDLDRAIADYTTKARESGHRARWLTAIKAVTPENARVGDAVNDATARQLWSEAEQ